MSELENGPRGRQPAGIGVIVSSFISVLAVILLTNGPASPFLPLLWFPLILAVACCGLKAAVTTGLVLACSHLFVTRDTLQSTGFQPTGDSARELVHAALYVAMAVASCMIVRYVKREPPAISAAERQGLLGLAYTDPMTGLYNFRKFRSHLENELKRASRYGHPLSLILIDLDGFKGVNDQYGHPAGDRVLAAAATVIKASVRTSDLPARYGGEEFVVVCPETTSDEAVVVAERIRAALDQCRTEVAPGALCHVTCSAGVASFPDHARDDIGLIEAADGALYYAKAHGKNRVDSPATSRSRT
jgi:diguanylate cyclase (GGDEF)-like protein